MLCKRSRRRFANFFLQPERLRASCSFTSRSTPFLLFALSSCLYSFSANSPSFSSVSLLQLFALGLYQQQNPTIPHTSSRLNMRAFSGLSFLLSLAIPLTALTSVAADAHDAQFRRRDHRKRMPDTSSVEKRSFDNARFTYFVDGLGACGQTNAPSDFVRKPISPSFGSSLTCHS